MSFISSLGEWLRKVSKSFMSATISGKTITLTRHNGDTVTLTTQDTTYEQASQSTSGLMSADDKKKLDDISAGAEINQNAFASILVDNTNVAADTKSDTLTLVAGSNITLTPDATNNTITIAATDTDVWKGYTLDIGTNNTTDTWVVVINNDKIQHRVIPADAKFTDTLPTSTNHTHPYLPLSGGGTINGTVSADDFIKNTPTTSYIKKFYDGTMMYVQFFWPLNQSYSPGGAFEIVYPEAFKGIHSVVGVATEGYFRPVYIGNDRINFWVVGPNGNFQTSNPIVSLIVIGYYR